MCNALITSLIDRYLHDNATIDVVSSTLRKICPRLYSTDDETCSKVSYRTLPFSFLFLITIWEKGHENDYIPVLFSDLSEVEKGLLCL